MERASGVFFGLWLVVISFLCFRHEANFQTQKAAVQYQKASQEFKENITKILQESVKQSEIKIADIVENKLTEEQAKYGEKTAQIRVEFEEIKSAFRQFTQEIHDAKNR